MNSLPVGTILSCPDCGLELAEVVVELFYGDQIRSVNFASLNNQPIGYAERANCVECGAAFGRGNYATQKNELHTKQYGWV